MRGGVRKKKLIEATQLWLNGNINKGDGDLEGDLKAWGLSADQISSIFLSVENTESEPEFALFPENQAAWNAFLTIRTQYVVSPAGGLTGLNYPAVECGLRMAGIEITPVLFAKIRVIENVLIEWSRSNGK